MKYSWWILTRPSGVESLVLTTPEIEQSTADKLAARLYDGGKMEWCPAPDLPQTVDSPS